MTQNSVTYQLTPTKLLALTRRGYDLTCNVCHKQLLPGDLIHRNGRNAICRIRGRIYPSHLKEEKQ